MRDIRSLVKIFANGTVFSRVMSSGEKESIDDFLTDSPGEIDLVKGSELKSKLIQIIENVSARLKSLAQARPSLTAIRYKELIFRLRRKLATADRMLRPSMPIQSISFNEEILSYLKPEMLKRIMENISWKNQDPDYYSGQRKIILSLDEPIVLKNGTTINSLEIKGVVYRIEDDVVPPLQELYKTMKIVRMDKNNLTAMTNRILLKGGMSLTAAKREYMILEKLYAQGNSRYDYPVGHGMYKNYTFKGKQFGFIITGVENSRRKRMGDWFKDKYQKIFDLIKADKVRFAKLAVELFEAHETFLRRYGQELRRFHDRGFYHGYPHMLNVSWDKEFKNIVLNDFEASKMISRLPVEKRVGYRLIDISSAYAHFISFITGAQNLFALVSFSNAMNDLGNPFRFFLEGYLGSDMQNYDFAQFMNESVYPAVVGGVDVINEMDQGIVSKLFNIEGSEYKRFDYIDKIVFDEQVFLNEIVCEQAI
ncbi:MAG: hypothetical protein L6416_06105 [Candidatus Omnitrophica bacterium]|nr:hypothetical protein [Candidatus Omnitrophota bacterium]